MQSVSEEVAIYAAGVKLFFVVLYRDAGDDQVVFNGRLQ